MSRRSKPILGAALLAISALATTAMPTHSADADLLLPFSQTSSSTNKSALDRYLLCSFYPKPGTCESVYHKALNDSSIAAEAVRAEYMGYARYLKGTGKLTDADREYLKSNGITVPKDLNSTNQTGLHNVINDSNIAPEQKRASINNFLSRAVQAELYCRFNSCEEPEQKTNSGA